MPAAQPQAVAKDNQQFHGITIASASRRIIATTPAREQISRETIASDDYRKMYA